MNFIKIVLILTISCNSLYSQLTVNNMYNASNRTFTVDHWVLESFIKDRESNKLAEEEITFQYRLLDSLQQELSISYDITNTLDSIINKKDSQIVSQNLQLEVSKDLYTNCTEERLYGNIVLDTMEKKLKQEKNKTLKHKIFNVLLSSGLGILLLSLLI